MFSALKSCGASARVSFAALALLGMAIGWSVPVATAAAPGATPVYTVSPVGWVRKSGGRTFIEIERRYQPALMGVGQLKSIWVLYWFDRNDSPEKRAVLQVHPRGGQYLAQFVVELACQARALLLDACFAMAGQPAQFLA